MNSDKFKVVVIENTGNLKVGDVYEVELSRADQGLDLYLIGDMYDSASFFLRLPKQETSCKDMTMQEYLAVMVLLNDERYLVECCHEDDSHWTEPYNLLKTYRMPIRWTLKEDPKLKEIKRIKSEMEKLAKELKDLEGVK